MTTNERALVAAGVVLAAVVALWLVWPYLVGGGVAWIAYRHLTRHERRPRPRSSYSSLGRTAALLYAARNSRWLKPDRRRGAAAAPVGPYSRRDRVEPDGFDDIPY